jgi:uncharacterized protein with beta-barrel porin domain
VTTFTNQVIVACSRLHHPGFVTGYMILNSSALSIFRALHYTLKKIVPTQSTLSQAALSYYTDRAIIQLSTQRHQQPTRQLSNNIYASHHVLLHDSKKVGKQQLENTTQHNTTQHNTARSGGMNERRAVLQELWNVGDACQEIYAAKSCWSAGDWCR